MTSLAVIENKISTIQKYLHILDGYQCHTRKEIEDNVTIRGAVERYLYLVAQAAIELAEATIAFKNLRKPSTMGESFSILAEGGLIPEAVSEKMIKLAGFRNVIAHEYEKINYDIVYAVLQQKLGDVEEFVDSIRRALNVR